MPLEVFQVNEKYGLRNKSGLIVYPPEFGEIIAGKNNFVAVKYIENGADEDACERKVFSIDQSGDIIADIGNELTAKGYPNFQEISYLTGDLYCFQHMEFSGCDVTGVFHADGFIVVQPKYDEIDSLDDLVLLGYYSPRNHSFEFDYEEEDGYYILSMQGALLWEGSVTRDCDYDDDNNLVFQTRSGGEVVISAQGKLIKENQ